MTTGMGIFISNPATSVEKERFSGIKNGDRNPEQNFLESTFHYLLLAFYAFSPKPIGKFIILQTFYGHAHSEGHQLF
jgi:hypothetical protein